MKKLAVSKENPCKACLSCVRACSEAFYKTFDPDLSCIRITAKPDGEPKVNSCIMCGKCARTCPEGAITQNAKGVYMIDKKKCVGCGKCVEACPMHVMVMAPGAAAPSKCIACGICAKACPMGGTPPLSGPRFFQYLQLAPGPSLLYTVSGRGECPENRPKRSGFSMK